MGHAQSGVELCSSRTSPLPESTCDRLPVNDIPRLDCCKASSSRSRPVPEVVVLVPQPERRGISAGQLADFFLSFCGEIVFAREPEDKPLCLPTKLAVLCAEKNQRNAALSLRANGKSYVTDLYAVKELLILPQTRRELVSYAEKLNPEGLDIQYYISHHWAEDFSEFVQGILRHAIWAVQGTRRDWRQVSYWCCAFSNNQHDTRLGANLTESSFHKALRSERCIGMVLNLNRAATALFRVWCLYEMLLAHQLNKQFVINSHTGPLVVGSSSDEEHDAWVLLLLRLLHYVDARCAAATNVTDQDLILREIERHRRDDGLFGIDVFNGVTKSLVAGQAIFLLARRGHLEGVELAVSLGASASSIDTRGVCSLTYAVACGHAAIAKFLQGNGARQHAEKGAANVVAMWSECAKQRGEAIRTVEQLCHDDSQLREIHGQALEKAKMEHYSAQVFELVSYLCSNSAELRLKALKELLDSPSMREISDILSKVACLLLDSDARVRQAAVDAVGKLDISKSEVLPGSFNIVAQNLCAVDTQGRNIFHVAARAACANALHILNIAIDWPSSVELVSKALAARDVWHRTPAHNAVEVDSSEALRVLVKFGAVLELPAGPGKVQEGAVVVVRHDKGPALARICSVSADTTKIKVEYEAACQEWVSLEEWVSRPNEEWISLDRCVLAPTPLELAQELGRMKAEAELQIQLGASNTTRKTSIKVQQGLASRSASRGVQELDQERLKHFKEMLWEREGIDTSTWGTGTAKSVEALFWEVFVQRGCIIMGGWSAGQLKRVVRLVKVKIISEILGTPHVLHSRLQISSDGRRIERNQVPLKKLIWTKSSDDGWNAWDEQVYNQDCPFCEDWRTACREVLQSHLGLSQEWQDKHLLPKCAIESTYRVEDNIKSPGFPGVNCLYCIHDVTMRIVDPKHEEVQRIGLPNGQEFATTEGDFSMDKVVCGEPTFGSQMNIWTWLRTASETQTRMIKRAPLPESALLQTKLSRGMAGTGHPSLPNPLLRQIMEGQSTDWVKVQSIAKRIADPSYSLQEYYNDLQVFPEISLYLLEDNMFQKASSGSTIGDEFQRTIGVFFALYWLLRLDHDGKDGFTFGVDDMWVPIQWSPEFDESIHGAEKRLHFHGAAPWDRFEQLLVDSGLISRENGEMRVNEERVATLLALTVIHDIMKISALLPVVQMEHAPYNGYAAGDTIRDHDFALSYIMDYYPELLPSFSGLPTQERDSVKFTQCNLSFNHGWVVQAEAPPGSAFTRLRSALAQKDAPATQQRDVALYFIHWFTDLAGAEPTPLGGCEKFVMKFPLPVLNSFVRSFEFVGKIATNTETEVNEEYLKVRWKESSPSLGPLPTGREAIAMMRLACMAQANATAILAGFRELSEDDREVLSLEMARTGCEGQCYSSSLCPDEVKDAPAGPAFLVYYGPAFLQNLGSDCPVQRLGVLAEIYRTARQLWPPSPKEVGSSVIVRIDTLKTLSVSDMVNVIRDGRMLVMLKCNGSEAFVRQASVPELNGLLADTGSPFQVMNVTGSGAQQATK